VNGQDLKNWILDFDVATSRPLVLGILNLTPDSFWDGGHYTTLKNSLNRVEQMIDEGVDILDIGGESTRPGSIRIDVKTEYERVIPIVQAIRKEFDIAISIDTYKPEMMHAALDVGADMINDVCALETTAAVEIIQSYGVPVCLMHISGNLNDLATAKESENIIEDIDDFFQKKIAYLLGHGVNIKQIIIDPGMGFGKSLKNNLKIIQDLDSLTHFNCPLLMGLSRKRFIGQVLDRVTEQRLIGTVAANLMSYLRGARIFRVHDIQETKDSLTMAEAIIKNKERAFL